MANPLAPKSQSAVSSLGLLVLRITVGVAMCIHGYPKVQNLTTWMDGAGGGPPPYLQAAAAISEFAGGIALAVGLLTPLAALGIACTMGTAVYFHFTWGHAYMSTSKPGEPYTPSFELALAYCAAATCILFCGPGRVSIDGLMWKRS
jgi:putative oxidoreductase